MKKILASKKKIIYLVLIIIIIISFFAFRKEDNNNDFKEEKNSFITKEISQFKGIETKVSIIGKVESEKEAVLSSEVSGNIERILVSIGEEVIEGQPLIEINSIEAGLRLSQAKASLDVQEARLKEIVSGNTEEIINIRKSAVLSAEAFLERTIKQSEDSVKNARKSYLNNDLRAYLIDFDKFVSGVSITAPTITGIYNNDKEGKYIISLYKSMSQTGYSFRYTDPEGRQDSGIVSATIPQPLGEDGLYIQFPDDFEDNFNLEWEIPIPNNRSATYLTYKNIYQSSLNEKEPAIRQAEEALNQRKEELAIALSGSREEQIDVQEAMVKQAKDALNLSLISLEKHTLKAPFNGKIISIYTKENNMASPGQQIITLFNEDIVKISSSINPDRAKLISIGDRVIVKEKYEGEVTAISSAINQRTGQAEVEITLLDNNDLIIGEYLKADIIIKIKTNDIFIPLSSLETNSSGNFIFTLDNGVIKKILVEVGNIEGDYISILSNIEELSNIILDPSLISSKEIIETEI